MHHLPKLCHLRLRAGAAGGLAEMELACLGAPRVFCETSWRQLELGFLLYRASLNKLCSIALQRRKCRWRVRPKGHQMEHLIYDMEWRNPRYLANYLDEDFVRRSKRLALKAHPKHVSKHVVFRYSVAACLRWTQMRPE